VRFEDGVYSAALSPHVGTAIIGYRSGCEPGEVKQGAVGQLRRRDML
jgi:hypothetical protein